MCDSTGHDDPTTYDLPRVQHELDVITDHADGETLVEPREPVMSIGFLPDWQLTRSNAIWLAGQGVPDINNSDAVDDFMFRVQEAIRRGSRGAGYPNV